MGFASDTCIRLIDNNYPISTTLTLSRCFRCGAGDAGSLRWLVCLGIWKLLDPMGNIGGSNHFRDHALQRGIERHGVFAEGRRGVERFEHLLPAFDHESVSSGTKKWRLRSAKFGGLSAILPNPRNPNSFRIPGNVDMVGEPKINLDHALVIEAKIYTVSWQKLRYIHTIGNSFAGNVASVQAATTLTES